MTKKKVEPEVTPNIYGEVPKEIMGAVNNMRERSSLLVRELGLLEIRKTKMIQELLHLEDQSNNLLKTEAKRLGIPNGTPWQLTPEGVALSLQEGG